MSGWLKEPSGVFLVGVDSPLSFIFNYKEALQDINIEEYLTCDWSHSVCESDLVLET
jgi:hypothetical protein